MAMNLYMLTVFAIAFNAVLGIAIIFLNGVLLSILEGGQVAARLNECENRCKRAYETAQFAAIPIAGAFALGELCGANAEQVTGHYDKDAMERHQLVYSIMGRDGITSRFLNSNPKFLWNGYTDEVLIHNDTW